jgi:hypothetical protein
MTKWLPPAHGGYRAKDKPKPNNPDLQFGVQRRVEDRLLDTKIFDYMVAGLAILIVICLVVLAALGCWGIYESIQWLRRN